MGIIFKAPAILIYIVCGLWGLIICFGIVSNAFGQVVAMLSLLLAPALLGLAPWYAGISQGDWFPLLLTYGGTLGASVLFGLGSMIDGNR